MEVSPQLLLVLSDAEVRQLIQVDALLSALERAFIELSSGHASVPPRTAAVRPSGGLLAAMPGSVNETLATKLVSIFPDNPRRGLPPISAVVLIFDPDTGIPRLLMNGRYLTAARTAAATAVSVRHLARKGSSVLAVLGAGAQGRAHLDIVQVVRPFDEVRLVSRHREHADRTAREFRNVRVVDTFEQAVRGADVICACTDANEPVVKFDWLGKGAHVASVGFGTGPELDARTMSMGSLFVESRDAFRPFPAGAHELQRRDPSAASELGELLSGRRPGRLSEDELTVYKSVGNAIEDAAAAQVVYDAARRNGVGRTLAL